MRNCKILIANSKEKDLEEVGKKLKQLNSKTGPFDTMIFLGDLIESLETLETDGLPPVFSLRYGKDFLSGSSKLPNDVTILNNFGIYQLSNGIKILYLAHNSLELTENQDYVVDKLKSFNEKVDIMISNLWSSKISQAAGRYLGADIIDRIVQKVEPKYHFAYSDQAKYFEFNPFHWQQSGRITRFINLPAYGSKQKWAYAFNLELNDENLDWELPKNITKNPFEISNPNKRQRDVDLVDNGSNDNNNSNHDIKKSKTVVPSQCHFCFTNPNIEDHMFISINKLSYIATAKGPLSLPKGEMNFSGHCLIIPIEHIPKCNNGQSKELFEDLNKELNAYELSITKMNYRKFEMSTIVFEIASSKLFHFHKQVIPIPKYSILNFETALDRQVHFNNEKFTLNGKVNFQLYGQENSEYQSILSNKDSNFMQFKVYETSDYSPKVYLSKFTLDDKIDLQFGRRVAAYLLKSPKRISWNSPACKQTKEQEIEEVKRFQMAYKSYDICN